jgi:catalase
VHNNQRDGMHRQAIDRGRVSYEPNSLGGGCPYQAGRAGFVSFPEPREASDHKVRGKPERFADHYTQATLFWNSQTGPEKVHIVDAFRFELSKVQTPAVRERMVSGLLHVSSELAEAVAAGLGMKQLPAPMPKVLEQDATPEVSRSPALSLFARPGDGSVRARRVAVLVADGVNAADVSGLLDQLSAQGAVARLIGPTLGTVTSADGTGLEVDAPIDATPSVLYDAVVVPDGESATVMAANGRFLEFVKDQYRHCKPMLVVGAGAGVLKQAGIAVPARGGRPDPGLIVSAAGAMDVKAFVAALAKHRHFERETLPPRV